MSAVLVIGAGAMGSAFCFPVAESGVEVRLVGTHLDRDLISQAKTSGIHPKVGMVFPSNVSLYQIEDLDVAWNDDIILVVLGVSSLGVEWAVDRLREHMRQPVPVLLLTKGLHADSTSIRVLPDYLSDELARLGIGGVETGGVGGPCIASELAARRHSSVVIAGQTYAFIKQVESILRCEYYHMQTSLDVAGVEACAALKNFFAIGVGAVRGMLEVDREANNKAYMYNPEAAVFTQAIREMSRLIVAIGGDPASAYGLPGAGDLYVTCQAGRNSRLGRHLGTGIGYREIKTTHMRGETVEGADLAIHIQPTLEHMMNHNEIDRQTLPLTSAIIDALCNETPFEIPFDRFT